MVDKINSQSNIQSMLQTLRSYQSQAAGGIDTDGNKVGSGLNGLNGSQGPQGVPLTDVVLSMQKSSLSFEATLQVRNKVLKAYEDILNMPV